jgi:hypothetical protein
VNCGPMRQSHRLFNNVDLHANEFTSPLIEKGDPLLQLLPRDAVSRCKAG